MLSLSSLSSFYLAHRDGVHTEEIRSCSSYEEGLCPCYTMAMKYSPTRLCVKDLGPILAYTHILFSNKSLGGGEMLKPLTESGH